MEMRYNDNQLMTTEQMANIAKEYYMEQRVASKIDEQTQVLLRQNMSLLEYISSFSQDVKISKCAIKTYSLVKSDKIHMPVKKVPISVAKSQIISNSAVIIENILSKYEKVLAKSEYKIVKSCLLNIIELKN